MIGGHAYRFSVNGTILTVTRRTDKDAGWYNTFKLRAYMPTEDIPDCTSTAYMYYDLDGEEAPRNTTEAIIHPSVTAIKRTAFYHWESLVRIAVSGWQCHNN